MKHNGGPTNKIMHLQPNDFWQKGHIICRKDILFNIQCWEGWIDT